MEHSAVEHIPVLANTLAEQVSLPQDAVMVDTTIGQGGHSFLFGQTLAPDATIIGFDVDENSIEKAKARLKTLKCKLIFIRANFSEITGQLAARGIEKVDFILADLGICSAQLADTSIGLSFQTNMPLDMRIDKRLFTTAADIVNNYDETSLADLIYRYGEDRASRRIARFIVAARQREQITTTARLASVVRKALARPGSKRKSRIHPATRTFQALRIAVNNELDNLEKLLDEAPALLKQNGQIAIISFHSLEDRIVKLNFKENKSQGVYSNISKKPFVATREEIAENPRARSAKLRIAGKM